MTLESTVGGDWDRTAEAWAASLAAGHDVINDVFGIPTFLQLLGDVVGLDVLDGGCGEGRSSRHLAARGARVVGVDVSAEMIAHAIAKNDRTSPGIHYEVASCANLERFAGEQFDLVTSFMALMDTADLEAVVGEFQKITKPGGRLAIMVRHPCFFTPGYSIFKDRQGVRAGLTVARYFERNAYRERWRFASKDSGTFEVMRFPHTLSDYVCALIKHGFRVASIQEPQPSDAMCEMLPNLKFWQIHGALYLFLLAIRS
jgi:SAM-dependent methyltransferase